MGKARQRLIDERPDLVSQLHSSKNNHLDLETLGLFSNFKAIWICPKCNYEYPMIIANKTKHHQGCPACAGKVATAENNFAVKFSELIDEWDWGANKERGLDPHKLLPFSNKMADWQCPSGHKYPSRINDRTIRGNGCPYCSNQKIDIANCFATKYPLLANSWDYQANYPVTPFDIAPKTSKKYSWICNRHGAYSMRVAHRANGHGCPKCNNQDSRLQLFFYYELKYYYDDAQYKYSVNGYECDIYLPQYKIAVEVDAFRWHSGKLQQELRKVQTLDDDGITLINIREEGLEDVSKYTVRYKKDENQFTISKKLMRMLHTLIKDNRLIDYDLLDNPINGTEFLSQVAKYPSPLLESSLALVNSGLAFEWDVEANGNLTPFDVAANSHQKVGWLCKNNKNHKWWATVANRNYGKQGCPECYKESRIKAVAENTKHGKPNIIQKNKPNQVLNREVLNTKICTICGRELSLTEFYKSKTCKFGVSSYCKNCSSEMAKDNYKKRKDRGYYSTNWVKRKKDEGVLITIPKVKVCKSCGMELSITDYYQLKTGEYGLSAKCKTCDKKRHNRYYRTDKCQTRLKQWVIKQHDEKKKYDTKLCCRCNQELPITQFYTKNNGKLGLEPICKKCTHDKGIAYHQTERYRDNVKLYYHKEETVNRLRLYHKTDKYKAAKARIDTKRRTKIKILSTLTDDEWKVIKKRYNYCCVYCGEKKPLTQDHIIPVSKGGHHVKENIIPACKSCNSKKGNRPVLLQILALASN